MIQFYNDYYKEGIINVIVNKKGIKHNQINSILGHEMYNLHTLIFDYPVCKIKMPILLNKVDKKCQLLE